MARSASIPGTFIARACLTNPNLIVMGQVGRGKSTLVKALVWRQVAWGRQAWIVDPKGEYGALARACGATPLRLAPGGAIRLNPLDLARPRRPGGRRRPRTSRRRPRWPKPFGADRSWRARWPPPRSAGRSRRPSAPRSSWRSAPWWPGSAEPTLPALVDAMLDPTRPWRPPYAPTPPGWPRTAAWWRWSSAGWWRAIWRACSMDRRHPA